MARNSSDPLRVLDPAIRKALPLCPQPPWLAPMLATRVEKGFSDPQWVYEPKLDGVRCLVFFDGRAVRLMSRNRKDITHTYPDLAAALQRQLISPCIVDGEIVAFAGELPSFGRLQQRMHVQRPGAALIQRVPVELFLFDILQCDGLELLGLPLLLRKAVLEKAVKFAPPIHFTAHRPEHGERFLAEACRRGWEGLIAKRADAPYQCRRSRDWLKLKCINEQEFVIGGWTDPQGGRTGFGALLVGYYEQGQLRYAGKVGTGFTEKTLRQLKRKLDELARDSSPFAEPTGEKRAHFVDPLLIAQVGYSEWTPDVRLRHPRFQGLRDDKDPRQIRRER